MSASGVRRQFHVSRTKVQHGVLLAAVLAVIGLAALVAGRGAIPDAGLIAAVNLVVAAGILLNAVRNARDRRPRLVLDPEGIWFRDWNIAKVPWNEVLEVYPGGARIQSYVCLRLRDPQRFLTWLAEPERGKLRSNRLYREPELRIPNGALDASLDEILAAVEAQMAGARYGPVAARQD